MRVREGGAKSPFWRLWMERGNPCALAAGKAQRRGGLLLSAHGGKAFFAAGRVLLSAHGGKAFFLRRAGVPFGKTAAMRFSLTLRRELIAQRAHTLCGGEEKNSGDICVAQLKGTEMWRGRRSGGGGCSFRRMAEKPFFFAAGGCSFRQDCGDAVCAHTAAGRGIGTASKCGSPTARGAQGGCLCTQTAEKTAGKQKSPLRGLLFELKIPENRGICVTY